MLGFVMLAGLVTALPPSPPIVVTPAAPAPAVRSMSPMLRSAPAVQQTFDVVIRADGGTIWAGRLTTSSRGQASFTQNLQQSFACAGPYADSYGAGRLGAMISLTLSSYGDPGTTRVSLRYQRPSPERRADPCKDAAVTGAVELEGALPIGMSTPVTLRGDAGLAVTLTPVTP